MPENYTPHLKSPLRILFLILFALATMKSYSQQTQPKDLLGNWESINGKVPGALRYKFIDSTRLHIELDGNAVDLKNFEFTYKIDTLQGQLILNVLFPTGFVMKSFLWVKSPTQIKMLQVDAMHYKDPLKDNPDEMGQMTIIFKKMSDKSSS